jgi:hypothetical protein
MQAKVAELTELVDRYCLGPSTAPHRRRRHRPPHPLDPPDRRQPRAARPRRRAAPHLDRRNRPHQRHRRIDRQRQGPDEDPARLVRRAGAGRLGRAQRGSGLGRSPGHRPAGGRETGRRQPWPRRDAEPDVEADVHAAYAIASEEGDSSAVLVERFIPGNEHRLLVVGSKVVAAAKGESLWVSATARPPSRNCATARSTPTRAAAQRRTSRSASSAPTTTNPARPPAPGPHAGFGAAGRPESADPVERQRGRRRHRRSTRKWRTWRRWPHASWAWTSPASTWCAKTSRARSRNSAAPSSKSIPARACWPTSSRPGRAAQRRQGHRRTPVRGWRDGRIPLVGVTGTTDQPDRAPASAPC